MMERRIMGSKGSTKPGAEVLVSIDVGRRSRRGKRRSGGSSGATTLLDKWFKSIGDL